MIAKNMFIRSFGEKVLINPMAITCDHKGNIWVVNKLNFRDVADSVVKFDSNGEFLFAFGEYGMGQKDFIQPIAITHDDSKIYICDDMNRHRVKIFDIEESEFLFSFGIDLIKYPTGIKCDDEKILISELDSSIKIFDKNGVFIQSICKNKFKELIDPNMIISPLFTFDYVGNLIYCDPFKNQIIIVSSKDENISILEHGFLEPHAIACDSKGDYLICDSGNHCIQVFKGPAEVPSLLSMCWKSLDIFQERTKCRG